MFESKMQITTRSRNMDGKLAWGIIGTGAIAKTFARGLAQSKTGRLVSVGSRAKETAEQFGKEFKIDRCHPSYQDLIDDPEVEAIYVSTPHPMHAEWAVKCAEAGKHILCEKPFGVNAQEAEAMIQAAKENDVFAMEAFMYRCHPLIQKLVELLRQGAIGQPRLIKATFSFHANVPGAHRLLSNDLAGGGILDVGCYPVSMVRLVAGIALGKDFADPVEVKGFGKLHETTGVDSYAIGILKFSDEIFAQVATGVQLAQENVVRIFGTAGNIMIPCPWVPSRQGGKTSIFVNRAGAEPEEIVIETDQWLYAIEADTVAKYLDDRQAKFPAMSWDDTMGNMRTLDRWREAIGLVYGLEKPQNIKTLRGGPLAVQKSNKMKYGQIDGIETPVSRFVMGLDKSAHPPTALMMMDAFFEKGGNCFDTAYIYGGGSNEKALGQWINRRGIRDKVVILDKGAHTPFCNPKDMTCQFLESLDRLQVESVDIYMLHRDNEQIPAGEFIDALNEHKNAGRMTALGVSNWRIERIEEANEYARANGLSGFAAISNQFSLGRMIDAPWQGCLSASDKESRTWFEKSQMPLMGWSSLGRGFFAGRGNREDRSDANLVRCWYSDDNFERLDRARELAQRKGVPVAAVGLAYILSQPFPTFPLIGPASLDELASSCLGLEVELTPDELKWLNLDD